MADPTHRILLVDDHPLIRSGLAALLGLQTGLAICGEAATVQDALDQVQATRPDLVIIDIRLAGSHGIDLVRKLRASHPEIKSLVISSYDEQLYASRCLQAGAMGYVNKAELHSEILHAVQQVLQGRRYLSAAMTQELLAQRATGRPGDESDPVLGLSDRELEVFQLIGEGQRTAAIAEQLHLSVHTIDTYREKIRHKLGVRDSAELAQRAAQWVLLNR